MASILKSLWVAAALALSVSPPLPAAVVVSSKLSSESAMIGEMIRLLLNANGIQTVDRTKIGATPVVRKALIAGEVDLYVEYTGNAGFFFNVASNPAWKDLQQGFELGSKLDYAANRTQFGKTLSSMQVIRHEIADMALMIEQARQLTYYALWLHSQKLPCTKEVSMAKIPATEADVKVADRALQIHGGYGYMEEYPVCRFYRDAKILTIGEGTDEVQQMVIARALGA